MARVSGSSETAEALADKLIKCLVAINKGLQSNGQTLSALADSSRDDSVAMAENLLNKTCRQIDRQLPAAMKAHKKLLAYAQFIENMESSYSGIGGTFAAKTQECWTLTDDGFTFDSPNQLADKLDTQQGKAGPLGTCGLCSVENVARMSGLDIDEAATLHLAQEYGLCSASGATSVEERMALLSCLGISSRQMEPSSDNIIWAVMSGRGVILSVDARKLYGRFSLFPAPHAIVVTSVQLDKNGSPTGITVCDSNARFRGESGAKTYPVHKLLKALTGRPMNVTDVIR